ncbi:MAG TPA: transcriptional repressor LexA [Smithellaceae bacterium]|jgi:repressor LexA|nr:transcriptional repressor LexA [Smithellaceae bacterium]HQF83349.1 transcriptional repressor LexA [Smithellaceae bacterium]HQG80975.1 transcriptional repressor LexA [Smithellaceae bacterium]
MKKVRNTKTLGRILADFYRRHRRMPSYAEMMELFGVRSKSVVSYWIDKLIEGGILEKDQRGYLRLTSLSAGIPLVGTVAAGLPVAAEESARDMVSMDEYLVEKPESSFLLRVTGDSMSQAGIMEGDLVVVDQSREPKNGDIVLAEVDGQWTMKYFRRRADKVSLEAANPAYRSIHPSRELKIGGVVIASVRKYPV